MSLDGLRAWIGVVERKLTMRTRVFLVLVAIAVGGAGAAIYLAIEAKNDSLSKSDLQQVRGELAGTTITPGADSVATQLEAEISALQEEVAALRAEKAGSTEKGAEGSTGGVTPGSASGGATVPKNQKQLEELVEKAEGEAKAK
jgi:hypothetical protein